MRNWNETKDVKNIRYAANCKHCVSLRSKSFLELSFLTSLLCLATLIAGVIFAFTNEGELPFFFSGSTLLVFAVLSLFSSFFLWFKHRTEKRFVFIDQDGTLHIHAELSWERTGINRDYCRVPINEQLSDHDDNIKQIILEFGWDNRVICDHLDTRYRSSNYLWSFRRIGEYVEVTDIETTDHRSKLVLPIPEAYALIAEVDCLRRMIRRDIQATIHPRTSAVSPEKAFPDWRSLPLNHFANKLRRDGLIH